MNELYQSSGGVGFGGPTGQPLMYYPGSTYCAGMNATRPECQGLANQYYQQNPTPQTTPTQSRGMSPLLWIMLLIVLAAIVYFLFFNK